MKELRLKALAIGGAEVLTRARMKNVLGGDFPVTNCATGCTGSCTHQSGTCKGKEGTCGSDSGGNCTCGGVC